MTSKTLTKSRSWKKDYIGRGYLIPLTMVSSAKDDEIPHGLLSLSEKEFLMKYFNRSKEHVFSMGMIHAEKLPKLTSLIKIETGLNVVDYYGYYGCGPIDFHHDIGTDLDDPDILPFVLVLKSKEMPAFYLQENSAFTRGFNSNPSFDSMHFINGEQGRMWSESLRPGKMVVFDPTLNHGLMTSMGYYLLCGTLAKPAKKESI
jgi:hypothetical protein